MDVEDVSSCIQADCLDRFVEITGFYPCGLSALIRSRAGTKDTKGAAVPFKWRHGDQSLEFLSTNQIYGAQVCSGDIFFVRLGSSHFLAELQLGIYISYISYISYKPIIHGIPRRQTLLGPFTIFNLVGGFKHFLFSIIYGNSNPNWLIFFRGVETTNQ